jgi:hypothetical protein
MTPVRRGAARRSTNQNQEDIGSTELMTMLRALDSLQIWMLHSDQRHCCAGSLIR